MNEEAEEVLEELKEFDGLIEAQANKLEMLDSRKTYKDILMNFYKTEFEHDNESDKHYFCFMDATSDNIIKVVDRIKLNEHDVDDSIDE
jgi:hypothetical protein